MVLFQMMMELLKKKRFGITLVMIVRIQLEPLFLVMSNLTLTIQSGLIMTHGRLMTVIQQYLNTMNQQVPLPLDQMMVLHISG